jgi:hypothetical protein
VEADGGGDCESDREDDAQGERPEGAQHFAVSRIAPRFFFRRFRHRRNRTPSCVEGESRKKKTSNTEHRTSNIE